MEGGGTYLGFCAGAYYACSTVQFEMGTSLEVKGQRELAFFPGVAVGSVAPGFDYRNESGAQATPLLYRRSGTVGCAPAERTNTSAFGNELGCVGLDDVWNPSADLSDLQLPRSHAPADSESHCSDWDGQPSGASRGPDCGATPAQAATAHEGEGASAAAHNTSASADIDSVWWGCVSDYVNGGPCFLYSSLQGAPDTQVLARYALTGRIAAVSVQIGAGRAVLCATHPELHPDWLTGEQQCATPKTGHTSLSAPAPSGEMPAGLADTAGPTSGGDFGRIHVHDLVGPLQRSQAARDDFFLVLLEHANLGSHLRAL